MSLLVIILTHISFEWEILEIHKIYIYFFSHLRNEKKIANTVSVPCFYVFFFLEFQHRILAAKSQHPKRQISFLNSLTHGLQHNTYNERNNIYQIHENLAPRKRISPRPEYLSWMSRDSKTRLASFVFVYLKNPNMPKAWKHAFLNSR